VDAEPHPAPVRPLAAFAVSNFRRFVAGQTISLVGSWTNALAQDISERLALRGQEGASPSALGEA